MARAYNHSDKAGNQGDVVKHPALMAALDRAVQGWKGTCKPADVFHYTDAFAGQAQHSLLRDAGWRSGIDKLPKAMPETSSVHVARWWSWYLSPGSRIPQGHYPGSSRIAFDICRENECDFRLDLFETFDEAQDDLEKYFADEPKATVHRRAALPDDQEIRGCDFLFIDPPGVKAGNDSSNPTWGQLKSLLTAHAGRPTLMWLPATGIWDDGEPANPHAGKAAKLGCGWSEVRWNTGGQGGGCVLIYSSIHVSALRSAVDEIARIAEWGNSRFLAVRHSRVPA